MIKIETSPKFVKHYKQRIQSSPKLATKFKQRLNQFLNNSRNPQLKDHKLSGTKNKFRSFSLTGDYRIIYQKFTDKITLIDIGTHNQVY